MEKINGYWIDENNNKWNCVVYSEGKAEEASKTLINCRSCSDCRSCSNCSDCRSCSNCSDCRNCSNCHYCRSCSDCHYCSDCRNCSNCHYCRSCSDCHYCSDCSDCSDCRSCSDCRNYKINPQRYVTAKIGSRNDQTTFYWDGKTVQVVCGCFRGDFKKFTAAVEERHGQDRYGEQYRKEIEKVKVLFELG